MADTPNNRGHRGFHRGRRGPDRRGGRGPQDRGERNNERGQERNQERGQDRQQDSRPQAGGPAPIRTENADVAQIMRDIRTRIAQRQGIALTDQQIEELAARRLEAILDVRSVSPDLLEQLRRAAGGRSVEVPAGPAAAGYEFEDDTIYETPSGFLKMMRGLLKPFLRMLFNPEPLIMALNQQAKLNTAAAAREAERVAQQAEWNALQYALLQRLVSELAKLSIEAQHLALQVESLSAKVDFNDRRVRAIEGGVHQAEVRATPAPQPSAPRPEGGFTQSAPDAGGNAAVAGDGPRRKRRRRRGRRPGSPDQPMGGGAAGQPGGPDDADGGDDDGPDDAGFDGNSDNGGDAQGGESAVTSAVERETPVEHAAPAAQPASEPTPETGGRSDDQAPRDPVEP